MSQQYPEVRFPDFDDYWTEVKIEKFVKFSKGKGISKTEITANGKVSCVRYGELYTEYNQIIEDVKSRTNEIDGLVYSKGNEVIIPSSGETAYDIATASCVMKEGIALGGDLNILTSKHEGRFLAYMLSGIRKLDLARKAQGISVIHLYSKHISEITVKIPSLPEQQKIAEFLSTVDKKIQALTKKKELLESYKKGVMQQIFKQEIRFRKEDGSDYPEWEEKRLDEVCEFLDNLRKPIKASERVKISGQFPYYGASGIIDYVSDFLFDGEYVLLGEDGANIVTRSTRLAFCVRGKFWVNNHAHVMKSNGNNRFLAEALERINYEKYNTGTAQPKLNSQVCKAIKLMMPVVEEQSKIANFLTAIDDKINVVARQIEKMKEWKKGLLQQMFV